MIRAHSLFFRDYLPIAVRSIRISAVEELPNIGKFHQTGKADEGGPGGSVDRPCRMFVPDGTFLIACQFPDEAPF